MVLPGAMFSDGAGPTGAAGGVRKETAESSSAKAPPMRHRGPSHCTRPAAYRNPGPLRRCRPTTPPPLIFRSPPWFKTPSSPDLGYTTQALRGREGRSNGGGDAAVEPAPPRRVCALDQVAYHGEEVGLAEHCRLEHGLPGVVGVERRAGVVVPELRAARSRPPPTTQKQTGRGKRTARNCSSKPAIQPADPASRSGCRSWVPVGVKGPGFDEVPVEHVAAKFVAGWRACGGKYLNISYCLLWSFISNMIQTLIISAVFRGK